MPAVAEENNFGVSEAEQKQLAAIPLPRLPTLVRRDQEPAPGAIAAAPEPIEVASATSRAAPPAVAVEAAPLPAASSTSTADADIVRAELSLASDRTGLDEEQLARIRGARALLDGGDAKTALQRLDVLNRELDSAYVTHTVSRGEGLWQIASKSEFFGNPYLWPLIWRANMPSLADPAKVLLGQKLRIPKHPRLSEVSEAIAYSHSHALGNQK